MSEPIELVKDNETLTVHAPRYAAQLIRDEGWQLVSDIVLPDPEPNTPLPGYDDMTASEILDAAERMTPQQRDAIRAYEAENKRRVTILRAME